MICHSKVLGLSLFTKETLAMIDSRAVLACSVAVDK